MGEYSYPGAHGKISTWRADARAPHPLTYFFEFPPNPSASKTMPMSLSDQFLEKVSQLQQEVATANRSTIHELGQLIGESIARDGVLHLFGSGHSQIIATEMERRAGGLVPVSSIDDPSAGWAEQVAGFGEKLFDRYAYRYNAQPGEYVVVISNSGKNASPLEVAWTAKALGFKVIALTSLTMSKQAKSLHSSGQRLFEMADFVLDNGGIPGDAALELPDSPLKVGPTSTMTGALLLNMLHVEVIDTLVQAEVDPLPIYISQNLPHGAEHNRQMGLKYRHRIRRPI